MVGRCTLWGSKRFRCLLPVGLLKQRGTIDLYDKVLFLRTCNLLRKKKKKKSARRKALVGFARTNDVFEIRRASGVETLS